MNKNKSSKFNDMLSKLGEYILFISASSFIIYFVFKFLFGTPVQQKTNHDNIVRVLNQVDTIKAMESFNMDGIYSVRDTLSQVVITINQLNQTIQNQTQEINNMKKVVNQKIQTANRVININGGKDSSTKNFSSNKNEKLDSFFKARYNIRNK